MPPVVQNLTPPQLAGVLGAILTSENINRPQLWVAYEPTAEVVQAVEALEGSRERLFRVQVQHGVQAPLAIDLRLAGEALLSQGSCLLSACSLESKTAPKCTNATWQVQPVASRRCCMVLQV